MSNILEQTIEHFSSIVPLPAYFYLMTEVDLNENNTAKVFVTDSSFYKTTEHIPANFYKPICKIFNE